METMTVTAIGWTQTQEPCVQQFVSVQPGDVVVSGSDLRAVLAYISREWLPPDIVDARKRLLKLLPDA